MTLRIRPVQLNDHTNILALAKIAGIGMSSLPQDPDVLGAKLINSIRSFKGNPIRPKEENFFFVLEDTENKNLAGTVSIIAHVGLTHPFYSYKLSTITQASSNLSIYSLQQVLHMVNDYTDATEIGSLFVLPEYRRDGIGKMLSRSRYLMLAEFPELFSDVVVSEIRGVHDDKGNSPFYNNLARHFFKVEFKEADYIYATQGAQFIGELMPKYPIYVSLLSKEARDVIGIPLSDSKPAMRLLEHEGFRYEGYLDLFDAGPTMQAERNMIRSVRKSHKAKVHAISETIGEAHIICNTRLEDFMISRGALAKDGEGVIITAEVANAIGVKKGDNIRYVL